MTRREACSWFQLRGWDAPGSESRTFLRRLHHPRLLRGPCQREVLQGQLQMHCTRKQKLSNLSCGTDTEEARRAKRGTHLRKRFLRSWLCTWTRSYAQICEPAISHARPRER